MLWLAVSLGPGCASSTAILAGASGRWPMSTGGAESKAWLDGAPTSDLRVEARLESPPRVMCQQVRHEPAARVTRDTYGLDGGGRFVYGFFGAAELGLGAALAFLPRHPEDGDLALNVGATFFALDGLASILMAFLIPDTHYREVFDVGPAALVTPECPTGVALEAAGRSFAVQPDGRLPPDHGRSLMMSVIETGSTIGLRWGADVRWTDVPPEIRCAWAVELAHPLAPTLCPRGPALGMVPAPH